MLSLYRKYRPQKFEEVYGQEGMVEVLKALNAEIESMCTSSNIYTVYGECIGIVYMFSASILISSILVCDAASISIKSVDLHPISFAKIRAIVVLPIPRQPENK